MISLAIIRFVGLFVVFVLVFILFDSVFLDGRKFIGAISGLIYRKITGTKRSLPLSRRKEVQILLSKNLSFWLCSPCAMHPLGRTRSNLEFQLKKGLTRELDTRNLFNLGGITSCHNLNFQPVRIRLKREEIFLDQKFANQ